MNQEKQSFFQRIRNAKQSLENAEKSFQDDRGMRGELDLMLAEAELKNLRKKQTFPWSWSRHSLAASVAMLLVAAGLCGWFVAKGDLQKVEAVPSNHVMLRTQLVDERQNKIEFKEVIPKENKKETVNKSSENNAKTILSEKELRRLVRSAKSELSSGK